MFPLHNDFSPCGDWYAYITHVSSFSTPHLLFHSLCISGFPSPLKKIFLPTAYNVSFISLFIYILGLLHKRHHVTLKLVSLIYFTQQYGLKEPLFCYK